MSLPHFFLESQVISQETDEQFVLRLSDDDAKHARVLRIAPGEHIAVIDAASDYFECEVTEASRDGMFVRIASKLDSEDRPSVILVQGLAKGEKMDMVVRHATELGVEGVVPLECERSVVKLDSKKAVARTQRWRAIGKSAAMQSGQPRLVEVFEPTPLDKACDLLANATAVLVCWEEADLTRTIANALDRAIAECSCADVRDARVAVVVGPEGGLTRREVDAFLAANPRASMVSLGPSILRTETAGIVAPALVLYELERRKEELS